MLNRCTQTLESLIAKTFWPVWVPRWSWSGRERVVGDKIRFRSITWHAEISFCNFSGNFTPPTEHSCSFSNSFFLCSWSCDITSVYTLFRYFFPPKKMVSFQYVKLTQHKVILTRAFPFRLGVTVRGLGLYLSVIIIWRAVIRIISRLNRLWRCSKKTQTRPTPIKMSKRIRLLGLFKNI